MSFPKPRVSGPVSGLDVYLAYAAKKELPASGTAGNHDWTIMLVEPIKVLDVPDSRKIVEGDVVSLEYLFANGSSVELKK